MAKERLQKILAAAGVDSRRHCEELILEGAVRVNRKVVDALPAFANPEKDIITVHGRRIEITPRVYYLLNKPKGVLCTNADPQGRKLAVDLVPAKTRVFCVGRLDADTTGLIIITNDNELTNRLTHPRYGVSKRYLVTVKGRVEPKHIEQLKKGVYVSEGRMSVSTIKVVQRGATTSALEISLKEGQNRQIRRMLAAIDLDVKSLKRIRIGRIELRGLGVGQCRALTTKEVEYLRHATGLEKPGAPASVASRQSSRVSKRR